MFRCLGFRCLGGCVWVCLGVFGCVWVGFRVPEDKNDPTYNMGFESHTFSTKECSKQLKN